MASRQLAEREVSGQAVEEVGEQAMGPAFLAAGASVGLAWYYFFLRGDRERGLFVGLWPPTILAFASYFQQTEMRDKVDHATGRSSVMTRIEEIVQGE